MTTPIETVADALIAFILSLLRDPNAVEEFQEDPAAAMTANGVVGACAADVRAVAPIIVDDPSVTARTNPPLLSSDGPDGTPLGHDPDVVREISRIINQFTTIDARATIIDQSTNQNIWTQGGDVTQIFDQNAVVAAGDGAMAAGDDVVLDGSDTTITVGDVSVGNTTGSYNPTTTGDTGDEEAPMDADITETDAAASVDSDAAIDDGLSQVTDAVDTAVDAAAAVAATEPVPAAPEPVPVDEAAPLMTDMTDSSAADSAEPLTPAEPEAYPDEPLEDQ